MEISGQDESHVDKGALVGKPLVLSCTLPASQKVPPIRWVDFVYNTKDGEPMVIFDGTQVSADHPQASRYSVNKDDYSLTINNVTGDDAGQYICSTKIGGTGHQASYMVAVAGILGTDEIILMCLLTLFFAFNFIVIVECLNGQIIFPEYKLIKILYFSTYI